MIGGAFLTMASHGTDQTIVQRLLAARNENDSRKALLASGGIVLVQFCLFLLVGVLLYVFSQHTPLLAAGERTDRILPLFLVREMPVGLAGLMLASIIAVAMSNASGSLNSLAASSILDFSALAGHRQDPKKFLSVVAADDAGLGIGVDGVRICALGVAAGNRTDGGVVSVGQLAGIVLAGNAGPAGKRVGSAGRNVLRTGGHHCGVEIHGVSPTLGTF